MADNLPDIYVKLEGLEGECTDSQHQGKDGWVQIKGFSFSFGLKGGGESSGLSSLMKSGKALDPKDYKKHLEMMQAEQKKKTGEKKKDEGPFDRPDVTLNKTLDLASPNIWKKKCHSGEAIPSVKVVACRYGGETGEEKIPFLTLIFEGVHVKSVSLGLSSDEAPSEAVHFRYDSLKIKYIWTSNDMGTRVRGASAPRAGWNFKSNKTVEWRSDE